MKKNFNKSMTKVFSAFASAFTLLTFFGCEIGLGPSVDVEAPRVEITSPSTNATVGSNFNIVGNCMDDAAVGAVEIQRIYTKVRDELGNVKIGKQWPTDQEIGRGVTLGNATIHFKESKSFGEWTVPLVYKGNETYECNGYVLEGVQDGTYIVEVKSIDEFARKSTPASRSFDIDNTSPVFLLSSPAELQSSSGWDEFGRTVTISGVIADTHAVDVMRVRAYDENFNEIALTKSTFSDFDKANTVRTIAAYSSDVASGLPVSDEVRALHDNYMALFGKAGKTNFDIPVDKVEKISIYLFVELEDKSGNKSAISFSGTPLLLEIREKTGIGDLKFEASDCMKIMENSYDKTDLNKAQQEEVRKILSGVNQNLSSYGSYDNGSEHNYLSIHVCPNNAPRYSVTSFEVIGLGTDVAKWNATNEKGTFSVNLSSGRDHTPFKLQNLKVEIFDVVDNEVSTTPSFTISKDQNADCFVTSTDSSRKSVYEIEDGITAGTYIIDVEQITKKEQFVPNTKHLLVISGKDENGVDFVSDANYGFSMISTELSAVVTSEEQDSVKKWNDIGVGYSGFSVNIKDSSDKIADVTSNALAYRVEYFDGHYLSPETIDESKILSAYTVPSGTESFARKKIAGSELTKNAGTEYSYKIPLVKSIPSATLENKNVTIRIKVSANNGAADGEEAIFLAYSDGVAPRLSIVNKPELEGKKIGTSSIYHSVRDGKDFYEIQGNVSDVDGSGVASISYSCDGGTSWNNVASAPMVTNEAGWSQKIEVTDGDSRKFWFKALDKSGNETSVIKYEGITFDMSTPTIELKQPPKIDGYYKTSLPLEYIATDGYKVASVSIIATLNGIVKNGSPEFTPLNEPEVHATLTIPAEDGKWEIVATATDSMGQKSSEKKISFTMDKTAPVFVGDLKVSGNKSGEYYTSTTLKFDGECNDLTGLSKVIYSIKLPDGTVTEEKENPAAEKSFSITPTEFSSKNGGENVLNVKLVDMAGNISTTKSQTVKVDQGAPSVSLVYYDDGSDGAGLESVPAKVFYGTEKPVKMSLYGLASDDSGLASVTFTLGTAGITPTVKYSDTTLTEISSASDFANASWKNYSDITNKASIKAWKADFVQTNIASDGILAITATDRAGFKTNISNVLSFEKDNSSPLLKVTSIANDSKIYETALEMDETLGMEILKVNGTWGDVGSGTAVLECKVGNTPVDVKYIDAPETNAVVMWSVSIPKSMIPEGDGKSIVFTAKDAIGNLATSTVSNLVFDYGIPEVIPVSVKEYYGKSSSDLNITFSGKDTRGISSIKFVSSSCGGKNADCGFVEGKISTATIKLDGSDIDVNGKWVITVKAVDISGRESAPYTITTTIDGVLPEKPVISYVGGKAVSDSTWYNSSVLQVKAKAVDAGGSGLRSVYYKVTDTSKTAPVDLENNNDGSVAVVSGQDFTFTVSDLLETVGTKKASVWLQSVDMAGNKSELSSVNINIDKVSPEVSVSYYALGATKAKSVSGMVRTNAKNDISVYGRISESGSGLGLFNVFIDGTKVESAEVFYSPVELTSADTLPTFSSSKTGAKSFKIVIPKEEIEAGLLKVTVKDMAGNVVDQNLFSLIKDDVSPKINLKTPSTRLVSGTDIGNTSSTHKADVNGTISISGSASDEDLDNVTMSWSTNDSDWSNPIEKFGQEALNWNFTVNMTKKDGGLLKFVDDEKYNGIADKNVLIKIVAKDTAGNVQENIYSYNASPYSDRPVISLGNISLSDVGGSLMSESNAIWVTSKSIFGTVSDDDGVPSVRYKIDGVHSNFVTLPVTNGSWNINLDNDGSSKISFEITDNDGNVFVSGNDSWFAPVLTDGTNTIDDYSFLNLKVDTKAPEVGTVSYSVKHFDKWTSYSERFIDGHFGGDYSSMKLKFTISDDNNIKSVDIKIDGRTVASATNPANGEFISDEINLTSLGDGTKTADITVTDNSNVSTHKTFSLIVDNTAPEISITAPSEVKSATKVYGTVNEIGGKVYFAVAKQGDDMSFVTTKAEPDENGAKRWGQIKDATLAWTVSFDDGITTDKETHTDMFKWYLTTDKGIGVEEQTDGTPCTVANINNKTFVDNRGVTFWIMAEDACGNRNYESVDIMVDPQGDKPSVKIAKPDQDAKLGGSIVIMGTAEDNIAPEFVGLQIDVTGDGKWTYADIQKLKKDSSDYKFGYLDESRGFIDVTINAPISDTDKYALKLPVNGGGWNVTINSNGELNPADGEDGVITLWAFATDTDKNTSIVQKRSFTIDKYSPKLENAMLTNTAGAKMSYSDGMAIKGHWLFEADIHDDTGISSISIGGKDYVSGNSIVSQPTGGKIEARDFDGGNHGYHIAYPVGTSVADGAVGTESFTIVFKEIKDASPIEGKADVSLRIDNKAPVIGKKSDSGYNIARYDDNSRIVDSNGFYTFGSFANEDTQGTINQTGVSKVAFYFTRDIDAISELYDVMIASGDVGNAIDYKNDSSIVEDDGLYWKKKTATSVSGATVSVATDVNIHAGGLAKLHGVIYRINNVGTNSVTLDTTATLEAGDIFFALANVVDNPTQEGEGTGSKNSAGYWTNGKYDDGDCMMESFVKQGTKWTWDASIHTRNIGDGKAVLHYVVFDEAGNTASEDVQVFIGNNQPRVAGLVFKTDDDDDGSYSSMETYEEFHNFYEDGRHGGRDVVSATFPSEDKAIATVRNKMLLMPEVVGGNKALSYDAKFGATQISTGLLKDSSGTALSGKDSIQTGSVELTVADIVGKGVADGDKKTLTLEIKDSTPGESMSATLNVVLNLALRDSSSPVVKIKPFYWRGLEDNSLFENSKTNGHIELSSDLDFVGSTFTGTTGLLDKDPKVSGKVRLEGVVKDDGQIKKISLVVGTQTYNFASYSAGSWTVTPKLSNGAIPSSGIAFAVEQATYQDMLDCGYITDLPSGKFKEQSVPYFSQDYGNVVKWIAYIDSENLVKTLYSGKVAKIDINIDAAASDRGSPNASGVYSGDKSSSPSTSQSGGNTGDASATTNHYRIDVVPYITEVKTFLTGKNKPTPSMYGRTSLGHYPLQSTVEYDIKGIETFGGETATLLGFNIDDGNKTVVAKNCSTGKYTINVNDVDSLNNINNNNAKGSYSGTIDDSTDFDTKDNWAYNRQPNGVSNDLLTDDVEFDVWRFNSKAVIPIAGKVVQPVMKINPKNGMAGFAFADGPENFSMGDGSNSYTMWNATWDSFSSVAFAYDKNGYSYGTAAGGDINTSNSRDVYTFMTSRWGKIQNAPNKGYKDRNLMGSRKLSIESICQYGTYSGSDASNRITYKERVKSPSLVAHGKDDGSTDVYLAYYDYINDEIRFRWGNISATSWNSTVANNYFGLFNSNYNGTGYAKYDTNRSYVNVAAGPGPVTDSYNKTGRDAGQYVCIDYIPKTGKDDVVVMVWYEEPANKLKFAYQDDRSKVANNTNGSDCWKGCVDVFGADPNSSQSGAYCKVAVDAAGGVHIAGYDKINQNLNYAYLPPEKVKPDVQSSDFITSVVDANGLVGEYLTLDTSVDNGKVSVYIGYYSASCVLPKIATVNLTDSLAAGELNGSVKDENTGMDMYTGVWNVSVVPSPKSLKTQETPWNPINVGVYKDADGSLKNFPSTVSSYSKSGSGDSLSTSGKVYGNGTKNPLMGYAVDVGGASVYVETAQMM